MALLKIKASTLLESLMALVLLLLVFFSAIYLLQRYYFIGTSIEKVQLRNQKQAEDYFDYFSLKQTVYNPSLTSRIDENN